MIKKYLLAVWHELVSIPKRIRARFVLIRFEMDMMKAQKQMVGAFSDAIQAMTEAIKELSDAIIQSGLAIEARWIWRRMHITTWNNCDWRRASRKWAHTPIGIPRRRVSRFIPDCRREAV